MVNAKVKVLGAQYYSDLEDEVNSFLATIDVRQIIKTEFSSSGNSTAFRYTAMIYYIGIDDIRDIKIDNILKNPL
jgi:hypothetical protein